MFNFLLRCKPSFFNLDANLTKGCLSCFCYLHSSECNTSSNHLQILLQQSNDDKWTSIDIDNKISNLEYDSQADGFFIYNTNRDIWFNAPSN